MIAARNAMQNARMRAAAGGIAGAGLRNELARRGPLAENPRVLVIDNFDSFTYNLVQLLGRLGAETVVRRNDCISLDGIRALSPMAIVISPGPGNPATAGDVGISLAAIREFSGVVPLLGVCLGHQSIIHALGGKVAHAANIMHGKTSTIRFEKEGIFRGVRSPLTGMRYHSLAGRISSLPGCLKVTATAEDGELMAVAHREHPTFGLQFHPESIFTPQGPRILVNFLDYARGKE